MERSELLRRARAFWSASYESLYQAHYEELASGALLSRWERLDTVALWLTSATASGSVIAGWTLLSEAGPRILWALLAGGAAVASITHTSMKVVQQIKIQGELRGEFSKLRVDLETFRQELRIHGVTAETGTEYRGLRDKLSELIGRTRPNILYGEKLRRAVQQNLNSIMKSKKYS